MRAIREFLERAGLVPPGHVPQFEPLAGGVSSDIWLVRAGSSEFCVKQALGRLRVAAEWRADVSRNLTEVRWLTQVARLDADLVPAVLASDASIAAFAMEYLSPDRHELWKSQLARGYVDSGDRCRCRPAARIHSRRVCEIADGGCRVRYGPVVPCAPPRTVSARDGARASRSCGDSRSACGADRANTAAPSCMATSALRIFSPRRARSRGPVFLDAECAWFGDPAFDLAFCLNHLLLKTLWVPSAERSCCHRSTR